MNIHRLIVHRIIKFDCDPDWHWDKRPVSSWPTERYYNIGDNYIWNNNLWIIMQGEGTLTAHHKKWSAKRGDVFLLHGNERYIGVHNPQNPLVVIAIHFDFIDENNRITTLIRLPFHRHFTRMQMLEQLLARIEASWRQRQADQTEIWMKACLMEFANADTFPAKTDEDPRKKEIQAICEEIRSKPQQAYTLNELAKRLHCSPRHFDRQFKEFFGLTLQHYILTARLEAAKDLLLSSSQSIGRIAELVGFNDIYYFSKWFKAQTGLPPSRYRHT